MARRKTTRKPAAKPVDEPVVEDQVADEDQQDEDQPDESQEVPQDDTPQNDEQQDDDPLLADYVEVKAHLDKLLMAEQRQYVGSIGRRQLHQIADSIRKQLAEPEVEEDGDE